MIKILKNKEKKIRKAVNSFLPHSVLIPLKEENFDVCKLVVYPGDTVKEGQVIAKEVDDSINPLGAVIHASIPGVVGQIKEATLPNGEKGEAVEIKLAGSFSFIGKENRHFEWRKEAPETLLNQIAEYGVINTFYINKPCSLAAQMTLRNKNASRVLIIRLFDEDPYRCTDSFLTSTQFDIIRRGAVILRYIIDASGIVFVYDKKQIQLSENEEDRALFENTPVKYVGVNSSNYPAGHQRELIAEVLKSVHEEPFSKINIYDLIVDSLTLRHVYNAIELKKPVTSQFVHVMGNCLKSSGVFELPIGISLKFLAEECGGFVKKPSKIILNGQLNGYGNLDLDLSITKYIKSIAFVSSCSQIFLTPKDCVKCGNCRSVCPAGLCPDILYNTLLDDIDSIDPLFIKASTLCSGCTLCNAVCSSRLPLSQAIDILKEKSYEKHFNR